MLGKEQVKGGPGCPRQGSQMRRGSKAGTGPEGFPTRPRRSLALLPPVSAHRDLCRQDLDRSTLVHRDLRGRLRDLWKASGSVRKNWRALSRVNLDVAVPRRARDVARRSRTRT